MNRRSSTLCTSTAKYSLRCTSTRSRTCRVSKGFDLISLLVTDFKYLGFAFDCLPIVYQTVFERIGICLVWYDDKLKQKLEEFYTNYMKLLQLNSEYLKLSILPVSLLESEDFSNVVKNSDKIRVLAKNEGWFLENKEITLWRSFPLKEFFQIINGKIYMRFYSLILIDKNKEDTHWNNDRDINIENAYIDKSTHFILRNNI